MISFWFLAPFSTGMYIALVRQEANEASRSPGREAAPRHRVLPAVVSQEIMRLRRRTLAVALACERGFEQGAGICLLCGDDGLMGRQDGEGPGRMRPRLREQQRTRRRRQVRKVCLARALVARSGSDALPTPKGNFRGWARGHAALRQAEGLKPMPAHHSHWLARAAKIEPPAADGRGCCPSRAETSQPATAGARAWMTGKVSHQDAQCAVWRSARAEQRPRPPCLQASCAARRLGCGRGASPWSRRDDKHEATASSWLLAYSSVKCGGKTRRR